jgi:hypothetical protein
MYPYNHKRGQTIQTDASGVSVDRAFLAHLHIENAALGDADVLLDGAACSASAVTNITTLLAQPDVPRNIIVTVAASTAGHIAAGNIVVAGTNYAGAEISESFAVTADTPATLTGSKAFKIVTSVTVPQQDGASVTVDVGTGDKLGLPYKLAAAELVILKFLAGATDAGTLAVSTAALESNTYGPAGALDGVKDLDLYIIV